MKSSIFKILYSPVVCDYCTHLGSDVILDRMSSKLVAKSILFKQNLYSGVVDRATNSFSLFVRGYWLPMKIQGEVTPCEKGHLLQLVFKPTIKPLLFFIPIVLFLIPLFFSDGIINGIEPNLFEKLFFAGCSLFLFLTLIFGFTYLPFYLEKQKLETELDLKKL